MMGRTNWEDVKEVNGDAREASPLIASSEAKDTDENTPKLPRGKANGRSHHVLIHALAPDRLKA